MLENIANWKKYKLSELGYFYSGLSGKTEEDFLSGNSKFITYMNVYKNAFAEANMLGNVLIIDNEKQNLVKKGDIIFTQSSETLDEVGLTSVWLHDFDVYLNSFCFGFRVKKDKLLDSVFAGYLFRSYQVRRKIMLEGQGTIRVNLASRRLNELELIIPPISEQKKISAILKVWDKEILKTSLLIEQEIRRKKSIVNKIYRHEISNDERAISVIKRLKHYINEVTIKNLKGINNVLSVSNTQGFIPQNEQFTKEIASKDKNNYKIIERNQFAYNPSRVNVGSIDQLTRFDIGILSPMYIVFKCSANLHSRYLYHYLKSDLFLNTVPKYTQGSVRDSLSFDGLSSIKLYIPNLEEQLRYASMLDVIDEHVNKLRTVLQLYEKQKQGLIQQLLTGKIRVKVD